MAWYEPITVPNCTAFSPDGRTIYWADSPTRRILTADLDPATGAAERIPGQGEARYASTRWVSGRGMMTISDQGSDWVRLCALDPATGVVTPVFAPEGREVEAYSYSPDGKWLATIENDRGYAVLRVGGADDAERRQPPNSKPGHTFRDGSRRRCNARRC